MTQKLPLRNRLLAGSQSLELMLTAVQIDQLLRYLALLDQWNKVYNLTAVRTQEEMLTYHLLDSLAIIGPLRKYANNKRIFLLDVGSGGGLPGVIVAICCPEVQVTCVDAVAKKTAFIQQVADVLALSNLRVQHARVETIRDSYDVITSRAFATLDDFVRGSSSALAEQGAWLAMKGKYPAEEIRALPASVEVFHVEQLHVPELDAERCLVYLRKRE